MRKIHFALAGAATLALAACGSSDDTVDENIGENLQADELNAAADNAAADANAELEALGNQQEELEAEPVNDAANATDGVSTEPSDVEDDVTGM